MPDRGQHDGSRSQLPAPAALQLSQMDLQEAACSSESEQQVQRQTDTVLVVGSGERQPLMGTEDQHTQRLDAPADLATTSLLAVDADEQASNEQQPVTQLPEPPDGVPANEHEPGLLERATAALERRSFGRADSAPSASVDATADAALAATQTGGGLRGSEQSEGDIADSSAPKAGVVSRAADLARRPSQPLEAGLGHDRLAIRTSVPTVAHDGASSSKGDAAGASSSAVAGDDSPVMRCVAAAVLCFCDMLTVVPTPLLCARQRLIADCGNAMGTEMESSTCTLDACDPTARSCDNHIDKPAALTGTTIRARRSSISLSAQCHQGSNPSARAPRRRLRSF